MKSFTHITARHLKQIVLLKLLEHATLQLHKLTDRHTDRQMQTQTDTETDRQTDRESKKADTERQ